MGKIILVKVSELKDKFGIRTIINHEHELYLWSLIDGGVPLPPIKITKNLEIIDGRHRVEAYRDSGAESIEAQVIDEDSTIEIIKLALSSNVGGALPPTKNDITRTMMMLINKNYSRKRILEEFKEILLGGLIRACYQAASWKIINKQKNEVLDLISRGSTVPAVSKALNIPEEKIKAWIKAHKEGPTNAGIRLNLSQMFTHFNVKLGNFFGKALRDFEDGEESKPDTEAVVALIFKFANNQMRMYSEWQKRWNYRK